MVSGYFGEMVFSNRSKHQKQVFFQKLFLLILLCAAWDFNIFRYLCMHIYFLVAISVCICLWAIYIHLPKKERKKKNLSGGHGIL